MRGEFQLEVKSLRPNYIQKKSITSYTLFGLFFFLSIKNLTI